MLERVPIIPRATLDQSIKISLIMHFQGFQTQFFERMVLWSKSLWGSPDGTDPQLIALRI